MKPPPLQQHRMEVAITSGGVSDGFVYRLVAGEIDERGITGAILEAGAGTGELTACLLKPDRSLTCLDLLPRPASLPEAVTWVCTDLNDPLPLADASFNAIICSEVIGYLENPHALFREFDRLLRPGGTLIVSMANQESIRSLLSLIVEGHFMAFRTNLHPGLITPLLRLDFERLCEGIGFTKPRFRYSNHGGLPKLPTVSWQTVFFGLPQGRLFSDTLMMVAEKPV